MGALLLTGGGLTLGLCAASELSRRAAALDAWCGALGLLAGELSFRAPPMAELLMDLSARSASPASEALAGAAEGLDRLAEVPFETLWAQAVTSHAGALASEDAEVLVRLGGVLGRYDWQAQYAEAGLAREALAAHAVQVREDLRRKGRAYGTLGLALGAFVTIILL